MIARALLPAILCALPAPARAGFEDIGSGARPMGMANAFTAVADDLNAIQFNPAGLADLSRPELAAGYARLYLGLDDGSNISHNALAYAHPLGKRGTVGLGLVDLRLGGAFEERVWALSYGRELRPGLAAGANLKLLERKFDVGSDPRLAADPVFRDNGTGSRGLAIDGGLLYRSSSPYTLGLAILDLNEPDMGLKSEDKVPRSLKLGAAYHPGDSTFAGDLGIRNGDWDLRFGAERSFMGGVFMARMGFGLGSRSDRDVALGGTYRSDHFSLDYAFELPLAGIAGTAGAHRFSLSFRFGKPAPSAGGRKAAAQLPLQKGRSEQWEDMLKNFGGKLEETRRSNEETKELLQLLRNQLTNPRPTAPSKPARTDPARAEPGAQAPKPPPNSHVVAEGETLPSIAEKLYGDPTRWVDIYKLNQSRIGAGGKLNKGQVLMLP